MSMKQMSTLAQTGATATGIGMGHSMIGGGGNSDSQHAFIDCILLYSKNLEADAVSIELQVRTACNQNACVR